MSYTHPTEVERYDIYDRRSEGASLTQIALALNRHKSTVSCELARNTGERGYRPRQADTLAAAWERGHAEVELYAAPAGSGAKS